MRTSSVLEKVMNPIHRNFSRTSYYIEVGFIVGKKYIEVPMKVDTGASHTIVGTEFDAIKNHKREIWTNYLHEDDVYDAQGKPLKVYAYKVSQFKLTEDIIFPKIQIWFSDQLKEKAVLGMDVLSLFNFKYTLDKHSSNGTFEIIDYPTTMKKLLESQSYENKGFIMPGGVFTINDTPQTSVKTPQYTKEDLEANYINKMIKEEKNKQ